MVLYGRICSCCSTLQATVRPASQANPVPVPNLFAPRGPEGFDQRMTPIGGAATAHPVDGRRTDATPPWPGQYSMDEDGYLEPYGDPVYGPWESAGSSVPLQCASQNRGRCSIPAVIAPLPAPVRCPPAADEKVLPLAPGRAGWFRQDVITLSSKLNPSISAENSRTLQPIS